MEIGCLKGVAIKAVFWTLEVVDLNCPELQMTLGVVQACWLIGVAFGWFSKFITLCTPSVSGAGQRQHRRCAACYDTCFSRTSHLDFGRSPLHISCCRYQTQWRAALSVKAKAGNSAYSMNADTPAFSPAVLAAVGLGEMQHHQYQCQNVSVKGGRQVSNTLLCLSSYSSSQHGSYHCWFALVGPKNEAEQNKTSFVLMLSYEIRCLKTSIVVWKLQWWHLWLVLLYLQWKVWFLNGFDFCYLFVFPWSS